MESTQDAPVPVVELTPTAAVPLTNLEPIQDLTANPAPEGISAGKLLY
jgi:hypothetical protein